MAAFAKGFSKLTQMVGEKVGTNKKTDFSDSFLDLEAATDAKKEAVSKLFTSSDNYIKLLSKKDEKLKVTYTEALGVTMKTAGQTLQQQSAYGETLVQVGDAQQAIGIALVELVVKLRQNYFEDLERANTEILEYKALRKKLEHRRVEYDGKLNKVQKAKKESPELEEDMREAKVKYEECLKDTESKMQQVMEGDDQLVRDLASYVDAHLTYFRKGVEVMEALEREIASSGVRASTPPPRVTVPVRTSTESGLMRNPTVKNTLDKSTAFMTGAVSSIKSSINNKGPTRPTSMAVPKRQPSKPQESRKIVEAIYAYAADEDNELSIAEGDRIAINEEVDEGWWVGENLSDGRTGMFPANYVKVIKEAEQQVVVEEEVPKQESASAWAANKRNTIAGAFSSAVDRVSAPSNTVAAAPNSGRRLPPMPSFGRTSAPPPRPSADSKPATASNMETYVAKEAVGYAIKHPKQAMAAAGAMAGFAAKAHQFQQQQQQSSSSATRCGECGCEDFKENVFKRGNCNNCFHKH